MLAACGPVGDDSLHHSSGKLLVPLRETPLRDVQQEVDWGGVQQLSFRECLFQDLQTLVDHLSSGLHRSIHLANADREAEFSARQHHQRSSNRAVSATLEEKRNLVRELIQGGDGLGENGVVVPRIKLGQDILNLRNDLPLASGNRGIEVVGRLVRPGGRGGVRGRRRL